MSKYNRNKYHPKDLKTEGMKVLASGSIVVGCYKKSKDDKKI